MNKDKKYLILFSVLFLVILLVSIFIIKVYSKRDIMGMVIKGFDSDKVFFKIALVEGGKSVNYIRVENFEDYSKSFNIETKGLENIVEVEEKEFKLDSKEVKDIRISFNVNEIDPGVYLGKLLIISSRETREIPILLEVQSKEVLFDSNIKLFPFGKEIVPGDNINAEIKIFDLTNIGVSNVDVYYFIKDFNERVFIFESENLIVDKKVDYSKSFKLPNDFRFGEYILGIIVKYKDSVGTSSIYFKVGENNKVSDNFNYWFIILTVVVILVFFWFFFYYLISRNKLLVNLKKEYKKELKLEKALLNKKLKKNYSGLKRKERVLYRKDVKKVGKKRINYVKRVYRKKLKKLKKRKLDLKEMKKKIDLWKKKGYDISVLNRKPKYPSIKNIKNKIKEWEKKGYDVNVLKK